MSVFVLKIIAMVTMLIDHITATFVTRGTVLYMAGRLIGRIAFPIFCFLIVEGFYHTRNVWMYLLRLAILAVISEIPFDMMIYGRYIDWNYQNVVVTLFIGLLAITLIDNIKRKFYPTQLALYTVLSCLVIFTAGFGAQAMGTDYGMFGVAVIIIFYFARSNKFFMVLGFVGACMLAYGLLNSELAGAVAFAFIFNYNGEKGPNDHKLFYLFYPVHLFVLGALSMFVF